MSKGEEQIELIDHRSLGIDIDLGGTARLFELAVLPKNRLRVRVADSFGHTTTIEEVLTPESLVRVVYACSTEAFYDYGGNLQKVVVPLASYFSDLDQETFLGLDERLLRALAMILELETELMLEVDLRDGIFQSDGSGWVQLIMGPNGMEKVNDGTGGFEIGPAITMDPYSILLIDSKSEPMARLYIRVEVRGNILYFAAGDEQGMIASRFLRQINPDFVNDIGKPKGALRFLASLRS